MTGSNMLRAQGPANSKFQKGPRYCCQSKEKIVEGFIQSFSAGPGEWDNSAMEQNAMVEAFKLRKSFFFTEGSF